MENAFDSGAIPSLNIVVEEIFSSCSKKAKDEVPASTLIEFMKPHMSDHLIGLTHLQYVLDPKNENPLINRATFHDAMRSWTAKMKESDSKLLNISFKDSDVFNEKGGVPFHRSTPRPSLEPTAMKNSNDSLDFSNLSPTSFTANTKDTSIGMDKLLFIEERYQELEYKHLNTVKELSLLKSQLAASEEQYAELKQDLDRTNKRLTLEQQVNADLQKSLGHNDDFKEEACSTKKEKDHMHRMWILTKRENDNLIAQVKDLEYERDVLDRKLSETKRKDEQKKKEFYDLQTLFSLYEDENKLLKKSKIELEEKLQETKSSLDHYIEVSEILKNKIQALTAAYKKKGVAMNDLNLEKDPSHLSNSSETSSQSENSTYETMEDLDLSSVSDNLRAFNGQDLLSELQECKFLDNHNKCYIEEHTEWLKIVKEHENCSQTIADKEKEVQSISQEIKISQNEFNNILSKYKYIEDEVKNLEVRLRNTKEENDELSKINEEYTIEIANLKKELDSNHPQKIETLESENRQLINELDELKTEREKHIEKYNEMLNEKENLQSNLDEFIKKNEELFQEKNDLYIENITRGKKLNEMQNLKLKNKELENDIITMKHELEQNCDEIKKLSQQLQFGKNNGKLLLDKLNTKIKEQNTKLQSQREFSWKLQEYVDELQSSMETDKQRLNTLIAYVEENFVNVKYVHKDDEDSTSTGSSESLTHHRSKRGSSSGRKSNYEKQQFKINKLEEKIEELESELMNEKVINENLKRLEYQINSLEMEKVSFTEEKDSILRELDAVKYDLSIKDQMMKQFEEKHKFDLDNLNQSYEKELELTKAAQIENQKKLELKETSHIEQIKELERKLNETQKEKKVFENMLEKQEDKMITLKKALSDMSTSTEDTKNFEMLVTEKESMLKFNRELLLKSNNSLKQAENRCLFLELLLDKCKMVILESVNDVLRSSIEVFNSYKNTLDKKRVDPKLLYELEILEIKNPTTEDFTEKEVWLAHNHLTLTSKLLKALVSGVEDHSGCSCVKDLPVTKSVGKFTLRPSKMQLHRLPSCDPDISSSSTKDELGNRTEIEVNVEVMEKQELQGTPKICSVDNLRENESETNWLGSYTDDLRVEMNNRKVTEKKFTILSSTWKSNFESTKKKYQNLKRHCTKTKDTYLRVLLQIVTCIKNHRCHHEQLTLIQALKLVEQLKDMFFDVFKLAGQYGASRQELHSIKCWNLIVEYVNRLHQENGLLRLYQCTSVQITNAPNNPEDIGTETVDLKKSFRSIGVGESIIHEQIFDLPSLPVQVKHRRCSSFLMMMFTTICFLAMCLIFVHIECIRNGNDTIMCPLDLLVTIKRTKTSL